MKKGKIIVISAPSGTGKSTLIKSFINDPELDLRFSISATTRKPREGEQDGVHYYFISADDFRQAIAENKLAEYEEVYSGTFYGTLKSEIERIWDEGHNVIMDIDVAGGMNVKRMYGNDVLTLFIKPPYLSALRERLIARGTDSMETIEKRLAKAEHELSFADQYDDSLVNDNLETAKELTRKKIFDFISKG